MEGRRKGEGYSRVEKFLGRSYDTGRKSSGEMVKCRERWSNVDGMFEHL